MTSGRF
ncbi:hypothetical protein YPPY56_2000, partial [Yersinia pestis PY-56]